MFNNVFSFSKIVPSGVLLPPGGNPIAVNNNNNNNNKYNVGKMG
jgi:hypothetical protein